MRTNQYPTTSPEARLRHAALIAMILSVCSCESVRMRSWSTSEVQLRLRKTAPSMASGVVRVGDESAARPTSAWPRRINVLWPQLWVAGAGADEYQAFMCLLVEESIMSSWFRLVGMSGALPAVSG